MAACNNNLNLLIFYLLQLQIFIDSPTQDYLLLDKNNPTCKNDKLLTYPLSIEPCWYLIMVCIETLFQDVKEISSFYAKGITCS